MRHILMLLGLSLLFISPALGQYSGQLSTASTVAQGSSRLGTYIGLYDHATGILGQYRYGMGTYTDIGFKLGLIDFDQPSNNAGIDLAGDFKYRVLERRLHDPFDLALGGIAEFVSVSDFNIFSVGFNAVGSYPVELHNGRFLVPYGRLNLRIQRESYNRGNSSTDFEIGFNMGTSFELSKSTKAFGEFQFDDPFAFFLGVDFDI